LNANKNFEWFRTENLQHRVDDLVVFIETDFRQNGFEIKPEFHSKIEKDINEFLEEGTEIWWYDNGERVTHFSCFIKFKNEEMIEWIPFWVS
jgi:hypothetical protein